MLVITRCPDEKFFIDAPGNPRITVKLLRIKGGAARLGVDADRSIRIIREELEPKSRAEALDMLTAQAQELDMGY